MTGNIGVIFDMDGVVMDNNVYHAHAWKTFCEKHGIFLSDQELHHHIFGRVARDTIDYIFKRQHTKDEVDAYVDEKEMIYREMYKDRIEPVEGLLDFLHELRLRDVPVVLATSAPPGNVEFAFRFLPIRHFFSCILDASHVVRGKPDPEIYIKAIRELGLSPDRVIVFEDSLSGVQSALGAGAQVIGVATTHPPEEFTGTSKVIRNFKDIDVNLLFSILNTSL